MTKKGERPDNFRRPRPVCLVILDGFGVAPDGPDNAINMAETPAIDRLKRHYPYATLNASGEDVGLPHGFMGNSEVGHLNIGAGRIVYQDLTRIDRAIEDGSFYRNGVLTDIIDFSVKNGTGLHYLSLLSDGGVHSHNRHLYALMELAAKKNVASLWLHVFLDGRDVPPKSALKYIRELEKKAAEIGLGKIATVSGRYYAMDRDKRWERTEKAYRAIVYGEGEKAAGAEEAVEQSYRRGAVDEFVLPTIVDDDEKSRVGDGDSVIFINFRADRARQLSWAFVNDDFDGFNRGPRCPGVNFATFTEYDVNLKAPIAFPPEGLANTLADVIADRGLRQFHTAETEKYAHVTFFFNGGVEAPRKGEERLLIPSPKVATYDMQPEMSAVKVGQAVCENVKKDRFDLVVVNFANPDMVGHTGVIGAAVKAIETIDEILEKIIDCVQDRGGEVLIMSDHGNAERMTDNGSPWTAHTTNPVPLWYVTEKSVRLKNGGRLADIAPTILEIMGIEKPAEMTGVSLIEN